MYDPKKGTVFVSDKEILYYVDTLVEQTEHPGFVVDNENPMLYIWRVFRFV